MNILANLSASIHFDSFAFELWQLQFDGTAGVGGWYLKLQFKLIANEVVHAGAGAWPWSALFIIRLDFKPIIISLLV